MNRETDIRNKRVLIKTWKQIKKCSTKVTISGHRQSTTKATTCFFTKDMKPFCGTIVQLDEHRRFKSKKIAFIRWIWEPWMVQEIIPECEDKIEYPLFKRNKVNGAVIKFTGLSEGTVVWKGDDPELEANRHYHHLRAHTEEEFWEDVAYDRERNLWDGQPIYCWDNDSTHSRTIRFYDAINKRTFGYKGERKGHFYNKYIPIPPEHYDKWIVDSYNKLNKEK